MLKNIRELTESEIDNLFGIIKIKRKSPGLSYEVTKRNGNSLELATGYGCRLIITSNGLFHSSPENHEKIFCRNLEKAETYLNRKGYDFYQEDKIN